MENKKVYIEDIDIADFEAMGKLASPFPLVPFRPKNPQKGSKFIFEITDPNNESAIIDCFQHKEYVAEKQLIQIINTKAPELKKYFYQAPMSIREFKEQLRALFGDIPDYLFEGRNYLEVINQVINHLLRKETASFVIHGIKSGKLTYDEIFYPKVYSLFYGVSKFNFHLASYHMIIGLWETLLENHYWRTVFSQNNTITKNDLKQIQGFYNFLGRQYTDFIEILSRYSAQLNKDKFWIKRTSFQPHPHYWEEATDTLANIKKVLNSIRVQRKSLFERKKDVEKLIEKENSIEKNQIDDLFSGKTGILKWLIKRIRRIE